MNRLMASMLGHEPAALIGERACSLLADGSCKMLWDQLQSSFDSSRRVECRLRKKDGSVIHVLVEATPIASESGEREGMLAMVTDITEQRRAEQAYLESQQALRQSEEQLRHAQKLEAVGRLAGGVAHDFNNLLSVVLSYGELSLDALQPGDPLREDMEQIVTAARRATELTRQLLAFSRRQRLEPRVIDLNASLRSMEKLMRRLLGEDVELALELAPSLGRVHADPGQIEQVIMNLAVNSRDAMPRGGKLRIVTRNLEVHAGSALTERGVPAGSWVELDVIDTGDGMDDETLAHIFEPFFTTKPRDRGTGLGLSTVFGIVKQSGGHITALSQPGQGARFEILLPLTRLARDEQEPVAPRHRALRGSELVLLVEDHDQVRQLAATILRRNGYRVLEARDAADALLLSEHAGGTIDLLLTDIVLPHLRGDELAARLRARLPDLRVLFMSGYPDGAAVRDPATQDFDGPMVEKPIEPVPLLRMVRWALSGRPPTPSAYPPPASNEP